MEIDVFTLFPEWFEWFERQRHVRNAIAAGSRLRYVSYRQHTPLSAGQVDDTVAYLTRRPDHYQRVFACHVLEHLPKPAALALVRAARAALLPGGLLVVEVPNMANPPPGCRFAARCKHAMDVCTQGIPPLKEVAPGHRVACVL